MLDQVLPFYVVCDVSYSMTDHLDQLNRGLDDLHRTIGTDPAVAERIRFCLIGFSGSAEVLVPLTQLDDIAELSQLRTQSATNFGAAFRLLRETIERDMLLLRAGSRRVLRPAVFFMSDGHPTDPAAWPPAYDHLLDPAFPARPNIIAFGIGDADPGTIGKIGTVRAFLSSDGVSPADALGEFTRTLTRSMVLSGTGGAPALRIPENVTGFDSAGFYSSDFHSSDFHGGDVHTGDEW